LYVQADRDDNEAEVECKCQLLLVLAEVTLDGSTPLICTPLFATLFCQAASGAIPIGPQTKVRFAACNCHAKRNPIAFHILMVGLWYLNHQLCTGRSSCIHRHAACDRFCFCRFDWIWQDTSCSSCNGSLIHTISMHDAQLH